MEQLKRIKTQITYAKYLNLYNKNTWYLGIEKEVSKMGYQLNVRSDPHHKINFRKLYSLPKPNYEEIVTLTTNDSLFSTEFENFRKSK